MHKVVLLKFAQQLLSQLRKTEWKEKHAINYHFNLKVLNAAALKTNSVFSLLSHYLDLF